MGSWPHNYYKEPSLERLGDEIILVHFPDWQFGKILCVHIHLVFVIQH